jgi:TatD DNase family protein
MIDTHCHLTDPRLLSQLEAVLARAEAAGVTKMVTIGTHPADWEPTIALAKNRANIRCAVGIHPNYCHEADLADVVKMRELQKESCIVDGIGLPPSLCVNGKTGGFSASAA